MTRVRECRDESTESRECRECEGTESRGGTTVHDESTVRGTESECNVRVQSRECRAVFSISFGHPCNPMRCSIIKFLILATLCPDTPV